MRRKHHCTKDHPAVTTSQAHGLLVKRVDIRIVTPGHADVHHVVKAKPGEWLTEEGVTDVLLQEANQLKKLMPGFDYRLVELKPNRFKLIGVVRLTATPVQEVSP